MSDYIYIPIVIISPFIGKLIKNIYTLYKLKKEYTSSTDILKYLVNLTPSEFQIWTCDFLYANNFTNIATCSDSPVHTQNIVCTKDNNTFYVECRQNALDATVTSDDIDSLLGSMILDNVHQGIVITTGNITKDIKKSLTKLPRDYAIQIITGEDLRYSNKKSITC